MRRRRRASLPILAAAVLAAAGLGCGGEEMGDGSGAGTETPGEDRSAATPPAGTGPGGVAGSRDGAAESWICEAVRSVDLRSAFGGALAFGDPRPARARPACMVPVTGAEGDGLIVQLTDPGFFEAKARYEGQSVPFERIEGLGREAFIINDADLNVLVDDETALNVGLSVFFRAAAGPPPAEPVRSGLVEVARAVIEAR